MLRRLLRFLRLPGGADRQIRVKVSEPFVVDMAGGDRAGDAHTSGALHPLGILDTAWRETGQPIRGWRLVMKRPGVGWLRIGSEFRGRIEARRIIRVTAPAEAPTVTRRTRQVAVGERVVEQFEVNGSIGFGTELKSVRGRVRWGKVPPPPLPPSPQITIGNGGWAAWWFVLDGTSAEITFRHWSIRDADRIERVSLIAG